MTLRVHLQQRKWPRLHRLFTMPASEVRAQKYICACVYLCIIVCASRHLDSDRRKYVVLKLLNLIFDNTTFTTRGSPLDLSHQCVLQVLHKCLITFRVAEDLRDRSIN